MKKKYDIIIPGWNMSEMTINCLKSIKKYTRSYRVIYVDNGSDPAEFDKIMEVLQTMPHLLIANEENLGFIKATNAGIRASEAPYVILMNNDTEAVKGWIGKLRQPLDENENVMATGPLTTTRESWQGKYQKNKTGYVIRDSGMLAFFCAMFNRSLFEKIGLLSESFGVGFGDDDEFCDRILKAGYKMALVQDLIIPHHHRSTFKKIYTAAEIEGLQEKNMQKYRQKKYSLGYAGTVDVVYLLGRGSKWGDNEIRYSIRSFKQHFKDLRNVVIVGELPLFLRGLVHIPYPDKQGVNKDCRMMLKIKAACEDPRVSENFVLCTDDTLLLHDLHFEDFTGWHEGPMAYDAPADMADHRAMPQGASVKKISKWFEFVYNTGRELKKRGLPDNNYDRAHCPQPVNKQEFIYVMGAWNMVSNNYTVSNIYNNSSVLFTGENIKGRNLKIYGPTTEAALDELTTGKWCINYNDNGLNSELKAWLYKRFPRVSEFELFNTAPTRRSAAEEWMAGGRDYDRGVAIFAEHAPKNFRLIKWFKINKGRTIADRKLQKTMELWMR